MRFCPLDKCPHYYTASKYPRKCFYEPQCWRGTLDEAILVVKWFMLHIVELFDRLMPKWFRYAWRRKRYRYEVKDLRTS